ncbi:MAG: ABC transporter permease [Acidobacteriota bacterium]
MKYLHLLWANLRRKKIRTSLTLLSIFVAFALFGVLSAIKAAFGVGVDITGIDRLLTIHKVSIIQPLPISYLNRIKATEGVSDAAFAVWFGGIYQEPKNFFAQMAVEPEDWLRLYSEFVLPEDQKQKWFSTRTGAVVGRVTAERFGWEVGDRIPIQGTAWRPQDGSSWEFDLVGIYEGAEKSTDETQFLFHYDYLDQAMGGNLGIVGWYVLRIDDPQGSVEVAERIDQQFANSSNETKTSTEKAFVQSFANQTGNIQQIVTGIVSIVFFTLLLVAGNTMAQSVRERTGELAVLKTVGFTDRQVMAMVLGESLLVAILGGGAGLLMVWWLTQTTDLGGTMFPTLFMPVSALISGFGFAILLGFVTGAVPAWQALRLNIVNALRKV